MPGKSRLSSYCLVRDSSILHTAILSRMKIKGITIKQLSEDLGIHRSNLTKYIKHMDHMVSQQKILAICAHLGISVDLEIELH